MQNLIRLSFKRFLSTGELHGINLGSSREYVDQNFGQPPIWSEQVTTKYQDAIWWIYGKIQIRFLNNKVDVFGFYFTMDYKEPTHLLVEDMPIKKMDVEAFIGKYAIEGMHRNKVNNKDEIVFPSGVIANFGYNKKLISVRKDIDRI